MFHIKQMERQDEIHELLKNYSTLDKKRRRKLTSEISDLLEDNLEMVLVIYSEYRNLFEEDGDLSSLIEEIEEKCKLAEIVFETNKESKKYESFQNQPLEESVYLREESGIKLYMYPNIILDDVELANSKIIMVVGQTGSGKTTLLNSYLNYLMAINSTDSFRYLIVDDNNTGKSQAHSQTSEVLKYFIRPKIPNYPCVIIVDTPGFGDTRGLDQDKEIMYKIEKAFKNDIDSISAVCFVAQSSNNRLTSNQKYIFNRVFELFGEDIRENILAMLTFCDAKTPQVLAALKEPGSVFEKIIPFLGQDWYFKFNNSAIFCEIKDNFDKMFWDLGIESFENFSKKLFKLDKKSLQLSKEVLKERRNLEDVIPALQNMLDLCLIKMNSMKDLISQIQDAKSKIDSSKDFNLTISEPKIDKIYTQNFTTHCKNCNYTCHENCVYKDDAEKEKCCAMSNGKCKVCLGRCHYSLHQNIPYIVKHSTVKKTITNKELEAKYYDSKNTKSKYEQILDNTESEFDELSLKCLDTQEILKKSIDRLKQIALNKNSFETSEEYIDLMIISEKDQKKDGFQQRIESLNHLRSCHRTMRDLYANGNKNAKDYETFKKQLLEEKKKLMIDNKKSGSKAKDNSSCVIF